MIDRTELLADLQGLLRSLEDDLLERSESSDVPEVGQALLAEYQKAKEADRTAQNYEDWRSDAITQAAVAWVLSCVFARFMEDNELVDPPRISGQASEARGQKSEVSKQRQSRLQRARDEHEVYFRAHPTETDREYLLHVFGELAKLPGASEVFGEHNPIHELPNWLSGDAAGALLAFFQRIDAETGALAHDFTDPEWDTRFLGDLYQDLSEAARKKYALLQTPEFIEEFILDRTLDPALDEFGLEGFKMIDPACGSGHFLLGAFRRVLERWQRQEPGTNARELVQRTLDSIYGVDLNPYAVAIARFRLLLLALRACGVERLANAPAFRLPLACGDSLLHGAAEGDQLSLGWHQLDHVYQAEDPALLRRMLRPGQYHAVVANPPYITPKDRALNQAYRKRYSACHMKYSLAVPFMQRVFGLAVEGGYTGQITANSFMKREFGKKLIEEFLPTVDLTHVIDTSGAYIPGHGTPTVILLGRRRKPLSHTIRTVMGIRGESNTSHDPALGNVWSAVVAQIDQPGSESEFVTVRDSPCELFQKHPWSIGGGGAAELRELFEEVARLRLRDIVTEIGFFAITGEDDVFTAPAHLFLRRALPHITCRQFVVGDRVRDWSLLELAMCLFPYDDAGEPRTNGGLSKHLWPFRTNVGGTVYFGKTKEERDLEWWEYVIFLRAKLRPTASIVFAFVATHNHFVLDRDGKVFKQSAPVIKLPAEATEEDHLGLLGLLNSSTACFWMKQVLTGKHKGDGGAAHSDPAYQRFEFDGTKLKQFPIPAERPQELPRFLDQMAQELAGVSPEAIVKLGPVTARAIEMSKAGVELTRSQMIAAQEELDWQCYRLYGLTEQDIRCAGMAPGLELGQRAFEIVMARRMAAGELKTTWFDRHRSTPITELPDDWPEDYKQIVERRIELIETDKSIGLIEQPEYKRRWNTEPWESQLERALRGWLLGRLESYFDFDGRMNDESQPTAKLDIALTSIARLADIASKDSDFMQVAELYSDDPAFSVAQLVDELVAEGSVPLLPVLRYKATGLRKRVEWEKTWEMQRAEDGLSDQLSVVGDQLASASDDDERKRLSDRKAELTAEQGQLAASIPVPPKYKSSDFQKPSYWRLRGKLDVPKERWVSFPHCEGEDGTTTIGWAGYDHLQLARAISTYYVEVQERLGGREDPRLEPLLACLIELLPWLKQWHNDIDPEFGMAMGDYFEGFIQEEARQMGKTVEEVKAWEPPKKAKRTRRKKK